MALGSSETYDPSGHPGFAKGGNVSLAAFLDAHRQQDYM